MVYLLHAYFGRQGREEAESLLQRNSGSADSPRILGAFNEPTPDWLAFYMFTYFTDRDGKYQLGTLKLKGSAFDPLSRTCEFMLKEEAHHMFVGTTGIDRVVTRTAQLMRAHDTADVRPFGGIPLEVIQRYLNFHFSVSLDLFGSETSTNVANYYTAGLKGRWQEGPRRDDHQLTASTGVVDAVVHGRLTEVEAPTLLVLNQDLRTEYISDCGNGVVRWNHILAAAGLDDRLQLPHRGFNRKVGVYAGTGVTPDGRVLPEEEWERQRDRRLPQPRRPGLRRLAHAPGLRAGQDRQLGGAAKHRHQRPVVRIRVRAPAVARCGGAVLARRLGHAVLPSVTAVPARPSSAMLSARASPARRSALGLYIGVAGAGFAHQAVAVSPRSAAASGSPPRRQTPAVRR